MPRPARRTRAAASKPVAAAAEAKTTKPEKAKKTTTRQVEADGENNRRHTRKSVAAPAREPSGSSDLYGVSDRELQRQASRRRTAAEAPVAVEVVEAAEAVVAVGTEAETAEAIGFHAEQQSRPARQTRGPDESGMDILDDDVFGDTNTSFGDHALGGLGGLENLDDLSSLSSLGSSPVVGGGSVGGSARRGANDTTGSSFNVGLFRRGRPRQSSVHSRDDAPIRPSSRGPVTPSLSATFSLGTFRRRAREPSILGRRRRGETSRHTSRDREGETSASELDDAGPFTSDAEPDNDRRGRRTSRVPDSSSLSLATTTANATSMLVTKLRDRPARSTTKTRKRKSEEAGREDELPKRRASGRVAAASAASAAAATAAAAASSDGASILPSVEMSSMPPSTPPSQIARSVADRFATPAELDPEIMAPPESSGSSCASQAQWPSLRGLANGARRGQRAQRHTPELVDDDDGSDLSSPPSLTHSPNYRRGPSRAAAAAAPRPRARAAAAAAPPQPQRLTTEALTALLPQRRHRLRAESADVDETGELDRSALLSEDDDELAHGPVRRPIRRGRRAAPAALAAPAAPAARAANRRTGRGAKKAVKRTYGSQSFSDKENQGQEAEADGSRFSPLPDDAFGEDESSAAARPNGRTGRYFGEELVKASKKFKEVDRWTLDFESVSRSSSPVDAR